jgi:hypothetical protein
MTSQLSPDLVQLGDDLEHAIAADIRISTITKLPLWRRSRLAAAATIAGGVLLAAAGSAAAVALLSANDVASGMPGSATVFVGTNPTCTTTDHVTFQCTLQSAPSNDTLLTYVGSMETFQDGSGNIAGGCIGQDAAGLIWTCYAGQAAVQHGIISPALLGQHEGGPASG